MKRYYYLDRIQDFGVLWPVLLSSTSQELAQTEVFISTEVQARDPQVKTRLLEKGIAYQAAPSAWKRFLKPGLLVPGSEFITASESNAKPHRRTHAWVQYAIMQKLHTITYQHGFENIGLTYSDSEFPCEQIRFESKEIRVWVCEKLLHKNISPETRKKIRFISRPFIQLFPDTSTETSKPIISVFENLHWSRYDDQYR
ncbi:MAG: hypothetical protein KC649_01045, partial [Candidatus Omnitrophica bacterium]|nr:hypothetical protein [Candidatus Omnitrophota bacterium]